MTKTAAIKNALLAELSKHSDFKTTSFIKNNVGNELLKTSVNPVSANLISQGISALKKEGLVDYEPSLTGGEHRVKLSKAGLEYIKKGSDMNHTETTENHTETTSRVKGVLQSSYVIKTKSGDFSVTETDYSKAQQKAASLAIETMQEVELLSVSTISMGSYKPEVQARFIAA